MKLLDTLHEVFVPAGWNSRARHPDGLVVEDARHRGVGDGPPLGEAP